MRAYGGVVLGLEQHLRRLRESALSTGFRLSWTPAQIVRWIYRSLEKSRLANAALRLTAIFPDHGSQTLILFVIPFRSWPPEVYLKGVSIRTAATRKNWGRSASARIKSNQYVNAILAHLERGPSKPNRPVPRPFEIVLLDEGGFLAEGTRSNVMIVKERSVFTPSPACGILLGVTRQIVKESASEAGIPFRETCLCRHDLYGADEVFLTSTLSEVIPVTRCDGRKIGGGKPGPVTRSIHKKFRSIAEKRYLRKSYEKDINSSDQCV